MSEEDNIEAKLSELTAKLEESQQKIADLHRENAKWRRQAQGKDTITQEEFDKVVERAETAETKLSDANKALGKVTKDLEAANKRAEDTDAAYSNSLKDAALTEALTKIGVPVAMLGAVKAYHAGKLQVADDNGTRVIKAGEKALGDFITEWAASDEGKHFIAAPDTSGGGSHNGRPPTNPTPSDKLPDVTDRAGRAKAFAERLAKAQEE